MRLPLLTSSVLCLSIAVAQDDARFLPVDLEVEVNGRHVREFTVTVFNDNTRVVKLEPSKHSACELLLDIDAYFTVMISKDGYRDKFFSIDTHLPKGVKRYEAYPCTIVLEPMNFWKGDPFFMDFPSAIVRWDGSTHQFDHSERYLAVIHAHSGGDERTARIEHSGRSR